MNLANKTIIVTGAASGIGAETVKVIKSEGAQVIGIDLNEPSETLDQYIKGDLSVKESIDSVVTQIPGGIDGICNIAGLPPTHPADRVLRVNFLGLRYLTENSILKLNNGASIVNVASLAGLDWASSEERIKAIFAIKDFDEVNQVCKDFGIKGGDSYFAAKEALVVWTMMNRWTWRDRGIRMNCVSPGPVETPILADFMETLGDRAEEDAKIMDRSGTPEDIAPVIAFLLSDGSGWIKGTNIPVDGGMYSHVLCEQNGY